MKYGKLNNTFEIVDKDGLKVLKYDRIKPSTWEKYFPDVLDAFIQEDADKSMAFNYEYELHRHAMIRIIRNKQTIGYVEHGYSGLYEFSEYVSCCYSDYVYALSIMNDARRGRFGDYYKNDPEP